MNAVPDSGQLLAAAVYEMRLLLAGYLGSECQADQSVRVAAHLAYALHNCALSVMEGGDVDVADAIRRIEGVDRMLGSDLLRRLALRSCEAES
jgi:hypothetical protein